MVYIVSTNLNSNKKIRSSLQKVHGLGGNLAHQICDQLGFSSDLRLNQLTRYQIERLSQFIIQHYRTGSQVSRLTFLEVQRLVRIGAYRGFRHTQGLPCRGQRTHGNSKTARRLRKKVSFSKKKK